MFTTPNTWKWHIQIFWIIVRKAKDAKLSHSRSMRGDIPKRTDHSWKLDFTSGQLWRVNTFVSLAWLMLVLLRLTVHLGEIGQFCTFMVLAWDRRHNIVIWWIFRCIPLFPPHSALFLALHVLLMTPPTWTHSNV